MSPSDLLQASGFVQLGWSRGPWVNAARRISFSYEVIEDHDSGWLQGKLSKPSPDGVFVFHSNENLTREAVRGVLRAMGMPDLRPVICIATR